MSTWVYLDERDCIMAVNPNDMTGNTGWQQADDVGLAVDDRLTDDHGAALYKLVNGEAVERSQQEREADWPDDPEPTPSVPEQIAALQEQNDMLTECILEMSEIIYGE